MNTIKSLLAAALLGLACSVAAAAELVVIGHPSSDTLTKKEVADLYLGRTRGKTLLDQSENDDLYSAFYRQATGRSVAQVKSTWARLVFSGSAQLPEQLPSSAAVKQAVADNPNAIGYIEKSAVDGSVKVLLELE